MSDSRNPFYVGSDRPTGSFASYSGDQRQSLQQQVQASQDRQLETQRRALQSMYHSEQTGVATAEELVRQGEVINRTEEKLDHIATVQKDSQKHINNLNSMFGGLKNWWRRDSKKKTQQEQGRQYETPGEGLRGAMATSSSSQNKWQPMSGAFGAQEQQQQQQQQPQQRQQQQRQQQQQSSSYEKAFNANMDEMSDGMNRLKQLALGLGDEVDRQNAQLERVGHKMDTTNVTMDQQNRDMNRILYGNKGPK